MKTALCFAALLTSSLLASSAVAAPSAPTDLDAARRAVFTEAVDAMNKKDWATCRVRALGAWSQGKHAQIAALLGLCEEQLGLFADAAEHLDFHRAHDEHKSAELTSDVEAGWKRVKDHVAVWKIESNAPKTQVSLNGKVQGDAPLTLYLAPGLVTVELRSPGFKSLVKGLDAKAGEEQAQRFDLKEDGETQGPGSTGRPSWPGWLLGGVGLAGVGAGAALLGVGQASLGDAEDAGAALRAAGGSCVAGAAQTGSCADAQDAVDQASTLSTAGVITTSVGGAALIAGVIYLLVPNQKGDAEEVAVLPWVGDRTAGVMVGGAW